MPTERKKKTTKEENAKNNSTKNTIHVKKDHRKVVFFCILWF